MLWSRILLPACASLLASSLSAAAPAPLDLHWDADAQPIVSRTWAPQDWSAARALRVPMRCAKATGTRVELLLLSPDVENAYRWSFSADWEGAVPVELAPRWFQAVGTPRGWDHIAGVALRRVEQRRPGTLLDLASIAPLPRAPLIWISECEDALECLWNSGLMDLGAWKRVEASVPEGQSGTRPYWCWAEFFYREDAARRDRLVYERAYDLDVSPYDSIGIQAAVDRDGFLSASVKVDGQWHAFPAYHRGTGAFEELQIPISGKRLEAFRLDWSEPEDQPGGPAGKEICSTAQWITLHRRGMPARPAIAKPAVPAPRAQAPEDLLTRGIPAGLFFGREDIPVLREKVTREPWRMMWGQIRSRAEGYLKLEPEKWVDEYTPTFHPVCSRAGHKSQPWNEAIETLSFAYVVTGEMRYADVARRVMLAAAACPNWSYGLFTRRPVGRGGFGSPFVEAHLSAAVAQGYDWIYNTLTPDERRTIARALLDKGVLWIDDAVDHMEYIKYMNQGAVFVQGMALAALALALAPEYPEARPLVRKSFDFMNLVLTNYFDQDGGCDEGAGYWSYTLSASVPGIAALLRGLGPEAREQLSPGFRNGMEFALYMRSMTRAGYASLNFNDGHFGGGIGARVPLFYARFFGDASAQWVYHSLFEGAAPGDIYSLLWYDDALAPRAPALQLAKRFRGTDYVFLRSGWSVGDTLFALESGPQGRGHYHKDKNHFIFEALGERMVVDAGIVNYADPSANQYKQTRLHNALTFDSADQAYPADRQAARVTAFLSTAALDLVTTDATRSYPAAERALRHVFYLRPGLVAIADDAVAKQPARIAWNLHPSAPARRAGDLWTSDYASGARLLVKVAGGEALDEERFEWPTDVKGVTAHHLGLSPKEKTRAARFLALLAPVAKGAPAPELSRPPAAGGDALLVRDGARQDLVLMGAGRAVRCGDVRLAAAAGCLRREGAQVLAFAVAQGTELAAGGVSLLSSPAPVSVCAARTPGSAWHARVACAKATRLTLGIRGTGTHWLREDGAWRKLDARVVRDGLQVQVPAATTPEGAELVLFRPDNLDLEDTEGPRVTRVSVDGAERQPAAALDFAMGEVPSRVAVGLADGSALDPGVVVRVDGVPLPAGDPRVQVAFAGRTGEVTLAVRDLLAGLPEGALDVPVRREVTLTLRDQAIPPHESAVTFGALYRPEPAANARFLSDLKPIQAFAHGGLILDKAYQGGAARLNGLPITKSVMICPETPEGRSEVVYALAPGASVLKALVGIDDAARPQGSAVFVVEGRAAGGAWKEIYRSPALTGGMPARAIAVPMAGMAEIRLSCSDAGDGIGSDHAVWADARFE